ncbi:two-component sensor histidine kinase [Cystobacter fuscus]|uniref:histidine kinase n=1 Tax=Cystobacter fuscus TaxID=43 RepID=A0A250J390_9BACT|nr:HAMP domain-containing sensor histidine kinase [Cystobacter fuscus]ATB38445.1 two-component sensor histidine kinase [Cystobacter fuscus]
MGEDRNTAPRDTLVRRLSHTVLGVALVSSALTAGATGFLSEHMLLMAEDHQLRSAALHLLDEAAGLDEAQAGEVANHELTELAGSAIGITLFAGERRLGGAPGIDALSGCEWSRAPGQAGLRRCGVAAGGRLVVTEQHLAFVPLMRSWLAGAALLAAVGAALLSLAMSRRMARWAARPLTELSESLSRLQPGMPVPAPLDTPARYAEVDALRVALVELLGRSQEALEQSRRFSANAAHELRTPLAALRIELELQAENPHPPDTAASLARLLRTVISLGTLVERLLVLADGARGTLEWVEPVRLPELTEEVLLGLAKEAASRVRVETEGAGQVRGDAHLLRQLVENAVDNALKFSGKGPVLVRIRDTGETTLLEFQDEGPGVSREDSARVFEPFYRSPRARARHPGHGIGLSLVALIARAHHARAEFLEAERGAHLRVTFAREP